MSIAGIASTALFSLLNNTKGSTQNNGLQGTFQQIQNEFQQLGQNLQAGNLSQARQDYATLSQDLPPATNAGSTTPDSPIIQTFNALSQDLHSGNLSAAQEDYSAIQQDFQQQHNSGAVHGHYRHHGGGQHQQIQQAFSSLSSALQSGNISAAQSAFATLEQDLNPFDSTTTFSSSGSNSSPGLSQGSNLSVVA